jgi:hypothetical protein
VITDLIFLFFKFIWYFKSLSYLSKYQCTSHQPISVADFGWRVNRAQRLTTSCLKNVLFLNFVLGGGGLQPGSPPFSWASVTMRLSVLEYGQTRLISESLTASVSYSLSLLQPQSLTASVSYSLSLLQPVSYSLSLLQLQPLTACLLQPQPLTASVSYSLSLLQPQPLTASVSFSLSLTASASYSLSLLQPRPLTASVSYSLSLTASASYSLSLLQPQSLTASVSYSLSLLQPQLQHIRIIQDEAIECDDFQIAVLIKRVEYKKHKKLLSISTKMPCKICFLFFKKITSPTWSTWPAVRSCNRDRKLTVTSQQTFITDSNFDLDVPFRPLTWRYAELNCN